MQYLAFFEDDFFYYLEASKNFIEFGSPTLDYITSTNGYHPLWFIILTLIQIPSSNPFYISLLVTIIALFSHITSFLLLQKLLMRLKIRRLDSTLLSIITTSAYLLYFANGMEVVLLFPVLILIFRILILDEQNPLLLGLLFNLSMLIRLDSALLMVLIYICLFIKRNRLVFKKEFYFPFSLILIYLFSNLVFFDSLMPVSGMAKQLKTSYIPVTNVIYAVFNFYLERIIYGFIPFIISILNFAIIIFFRKKIKNTFLLLTINVFPFIFILYNSIFSGWYLWSWYFYIFFPSILILVILFSQLISVTKVIRYVLTFLIILIFTFLIIFTYKQRPEHKLYYQNAIEVASFEKSHQGKYAIGDRAGLISYLIESPVVQLEGLMMDKTYLMDLKKTPKLMELLMKYDIDYYISSNVELIDDGWIVEEPYKHHKYVVTSLDTLRIEPTVIIENSGWKFYIFKIK